MEISQSHRPAHRRDTKPDTTASGTVLSSALAALLALAAFHLSLIATSAPLSSDEASAVDRAIDLLDSKGFATEVFVLRHTTTFRGTDNWVNLLSKKENAFAATNLPFQIVTLYPDFYTRANDETERAMILLHEAQHLMARDEPAAYSYVWRNRERLGWTQLTHGTTGTYVTIEQQTREYAPELFSCPSKIWNDCTETMRAHK